MDRPAYEIRKKQWQKTISECLNSGMNKAEWCRQNGISLRSIYYWQKKFRDEAIVDQEPSSLHAVACAGKTMTSTDTNNAVFVDLTDKLHASAPVPEVPSVTFTPELMISRNGTQIYVCGNVQAHTLEAVMEAISHA